MHELTLKGALEAKKNNVLEEWIHYLLLTGDNKNIPLSDGLKIEKRYFDGPVEIILEDYQRICGPEDTMIYQVNEEYFNYRVNTMIKSIKNGWDVPPILIEVNEDAFLISDGNHRYETLKRAGKKKYHAIFWSSKKEQSKKRSK